MNGFGSYKSGLVLILSIDNIHCFSQHFGKLLGQFKNDILVGTYVFSLINKFI